MLTFKKELTQALNSCKKSFSIPYIDTIGRKLIVISNDPMFIEKTKLWAETYHFTGTDLEPLCEKVHKYLFASSTKLFLIKFLENTHSRYDFFILKWALMFKHTASIYISSNCHLLGRTIYLPCKNLILLSFQSSYLTSRR